jgi:hypothetical protein
VLEVGGPLQWGERGPPAQFKRDAMNALIKIVKRDARTVHKVAEVSPAGTNGHLTTEQIVKSWITESRDRRHALVTPRDAIRGKEITRG